MLRSLELICCASALTLQGCAKCCAIQNGKIRALFRWEGTERGQLFHPTTQQIVPILSFSRPHSRAFHFAWFNFFICE